MNRLRFACLALAVCMPLSACSTPEISSLMRSAFPVPALSTPVDGVDTQVAAIPRERPTFSLPTFPEPVLPPPPTEVITDVSGHELRVSTWTDVPNLDSPIAMIRVSLVPRSTDRVTLTTLTVYAQPVNSALEPTGDMSVLSDGSQDLSGYSVTEPSSFIDALQLPRAADDTAGWVLTVITRVTGTNDYGSVVHGSRALELWVAAD